MIEMRCWEPTVNGRGQPSSQSSIARARDYNEGPSHALPRESYSFGIFLASAAFVGLAMAPRPAAAQPATPGEEVAAMKAELDAQPCATSPRKSRSCVRIYPK